MYDWDLNVPLNMSSRFHLFKYVSLKNISFNPMFKVYHNPRHLQKSVFWNLSVGIVYREILFPWTVFSGSLVVSILIELLKWVVGVLLFSEEFKLKYYFLEWKEFCSNLSWHLTARLGRAPSLPPNVYVDIQRVKFTYIYIYN